MQIHFGMSGAFRTMAVNNPREERETTRLVLHNEEHGLLAHLSAMTVQHGDAGLQQFATLHYCMSLLGKNTRID